MSTSARLSGFTGTTLVAATPPPCLRRPTFSALPEKVGKKMRWKTIYGAYAQILFSALTGAELQPFRWLSVRINVLHAVIDRLNQFQFCSFPEYSAGGPIWASAPTNISEIRFGRTESSAPTKIYNRTQIFCTTGESVDAFCIPRQRVLPSPCVATVSDGSVVSTQAARSPDL